MGDTYERDGVTYSAMTDAVLNLDDDEKVSRLASGKVTVVVTSKINLQLTIDATDGETTFTLTGDGESLTLVKVLPFEPDNGTFTLAGNVLTAAEGSDLVVGSGALVGHDHADADITYTITDTTLTADTEQETVKFDLTSDSGTKSVTVIVNGKIINNLTNSNFTITKNSSMSLIVGKYIAKATAKSDATSQILLGTDGINIVPGSGDGALNVAVSRDGHEIISGDLECTSGSIKIGSDDSISLKKGTSFTFTQNDYTATITAIDDATTAISIGTDGITFTPNTGDGTLDFTIKNSSSSMTANVEILSGSFTFGENGALTVEKGTELKIKFSDDYVVNFKATGDAGGTISLGADGITFAPNSGDGSLDISITRNGETRTANLNMTGSLTYKLDGSISWTQGTVIKSFFDDDSSLTITANKNSDAKIIFSPQDGLSITPSVPDALSVLLSAEGTDIIKLAEIDGTVTYRGGTFTASDGTEIRFVDPAGIYNDNVLRTAGGSTSLNFNIAGSTASSNTGRLIYTANEGATFTMDYLQGTTWNLQNGSITDYYSGAIQGLLSLSKGSTFDTNDSEYPFTLEKEGNYMLNGMKVTNSDSVDVLFSNYETLTVDGISYTPLDENVALTTDNNVTTVSGGKVAMEMDGFGRSFTFDVTDGSISYDSTTGKFSVTAGAKTLFSNEALPDQFVAKNDFDITVKKNSDGTFTFSTDDPINFAVERNGNAILQTTLTIDGSIEFDPSTHEISLPKGTVFTMSPGTGMSLQITALDDAGSTLNLVDGGIRFAPNANDGALEFDFVGAGRKMTLDVTGAFTYGGLGKFSLEDGTEINIAWEDGNQLKLKSKGSTGSIGIDPERGLKITSDDENLDLVFTSATGYTTEVSAIKGTIYYNAGKVTLDEGTKITGTGTIGGQAVNVTLETIDGDGSLTFNANGMTYGAGTGKLQVTLSRGGLASTFVVNEGSVLIGSNTGFKIAEGSDIATDLQDFIPALYFTTSEAGTYTINGQTITTSTANLALTATDDYMTFKTSDNVVEYDGMTFAGNGNVSLSPASVVLGAGVKANGFGEGNSFVLAEEGTVSADEKIFQLDSLSLDDGREIPMIISVTGAQDGFIFSRTLTEESEEFLGYLDSPYVGSIFTEKFIAKGDNSYRVRTDPIGLEDVIGISNGASISGGATLDDEETLSYYVLVTDTTGKFTIGKKTYTIADGSELGTGIRARFDVDSAPYADKITDLNGTISGDFTEGQFSVNGGAAIKILGDTDISVVADANNVEIFGLSDGATLESVGSTGKVHTDTEGEFVFGGTADDSLGLTVTGDPNITFEFDLESQDIMAINDLEGSLQLSETSHLATINGITCDFDGKFSSVGAYDNALYIHDVSDGSKLITGDENKIWLQQLGSLTLNDNELILTGDEDGIWIRDKEIVGLDEGASLKVSDAGNYTVNTANISAKAGDVIVGLENGNDAYIFNANNPLITKNTSASALVDIFNPENVSIVSASDKGRFDISLTGGDLAIVENTAARVNITAGDDTVVSQGKNVHLNLTGGDTWLFALGGKMTIDGYDLSSGTGFGTTYGDIVSAVKDGRIDFGNGKLSMSGAVADFNTQSQLVNFFDRNGTRQIVGFAGNYASLNASDLTDNLLLSGDKNSTLIAGSGNDTIFAAEGNFVDAGAGKNSIFIEERDENSSGTKIGLDSGGNTTVHNFKTGFDFDSDAIYSDGGLAVRLRLYDENLVASVNGGAQVTLEGVADDDFAEILLAMPDSTTKVAVAKAGGVIKSPDAQIYLGNSEYKGGGVDFSGTTENLFVNLSDEPVVTDAGEKQFYGINYVAAGDGVSTLIGSSDNDTFIAGNGYGSLWGGAGDDNLIGKANSENKDGRTSFFFFAGDGNDTVSNFEFLTRENKISGNADKIAIISDIVTRGRISGDNVVLQLNDGEDFLTIEDARGKNFSLNEYNVKIDKNISYDGFANCYVADGGSSLTVDSSVDSAEIWLDSSHGTLFFGNIRTLDASAVEGRTSLAGYALDETIIAGKGDSSLWGGIFGDDLLIGGESQNTFFYHLGEGNDTIQGAKSGDIVDLNTLTIDQVVGEIGDGFVVLKFIDGGSLTVDSTDVEFRINNDGTTYVVDNGEWKIK